MEDVNEYETTFRDVKIYSTAVVIIFSILGVGVLLNIICDALRLRFIYYPAMLVVGFATGILLNVPDESISTLINLVDETNANSYLLIFLPVMLFQTAFSMDYHGFGHSTSQVLLLSIFGYPFQVFLLTLLIQGALSVQSKWDVEVTIFFCIICSIIESELVLQELNKTQARVKHVQLLLQGEQLAILAMAKLCYTIAFENYFGTHDRSIFVITIMLWHLLGIIVGVTLGYILGYVFIHSSNDMVLAVSLTAFAALFSFYIGHIALHQSGVIVTIMTGVLLSPAKIKSTSDIESHLTTFWDWLAFVSNTASYVIPGIMVGKNPFYMSLDAIIFTIAVLILCGCCRSLLYVLVRPLLLKVGHSLSWTNLTVVVAGPYRAAPALIIAMLFRQYNPERGHEVLTYIALLCLLSSLVNGITLPSILKLLGMYDLTHARAINLKSAVAHLHECRNKAIHSLKMDRKVADANWLIVENSTHLSKQNAVFTEGLKHFTVHEGTLETHNAVCADCGLENQVMPTEKELADLELEGKHRILKAQLVSLWRQYESGTLSKRSIRILSTLLQNAMENQDPWLDVNELELYWTPPKYMRRIKSFLEFLLRSLPKKYEHAPPQRIKGALFRLNNMLLFKMLTTALVVLDTYFILNLALHAHWAPQFSISPNALQVIDFIFYLLFLLEFMLLICVLNIYEYFRRLYHKIDFMCNVLLRSCEIFMVIQLYYLKGKSLHIEWELNISLSLQVTKLLLLFRLIRLYTVVEFIIWKLLQVLEVRLDRTLVQYYDIGKAFLIANDRTLKYLRHVIRDKIVYTKLRRDLEADRKRVAKSLGIIQKRRPNVGVTIKTHHAIRQVLNEMDDSINGIYDEGLLDEIELQYLSASLENTRKSLRLLGVITPCSPELILMDVPWLNDAKATADYLLSHAKLQNYFYEDIIISAEDEPFGLFVLVSGLVKCIYKPSMATIENCRKHGALPNCDYRISLKLEESEEDYIVCGNVIGEIGAVTGRKFDMVVICQSVVQVYYIPWSYMWNVLFERTESEELYCQIWKSIGIRIAQLVLQYIPNFQGWLREKTLLYLERSFVPILSGVEEIVINELISDIILIEGMAMDGNTRSIFLAPFYIPRTTNKLILPGTSQWSIEPKYDTRLLIIPVEHAEESDIMGPGSAVKTYKSRSGSSKDLKRTRDSEGGGFWGRRSTLTSRRAKYTSAIQKKVMFHREVIRKLVLRPPEPVESTDSFSTDSDIPLMKVFQHHVKSAVKTKPENRVNEQNEFNLIEDVLEQCDEKDAEDMADYEQYGHLLRKKIKKKILKRKKNQQDTQTQTSTDQNLQA